jgi:hypothetical protein
MMSYLTTWWIVLFSCHSVNLRIVRRTFGFDNRLSWSKIRIVIEVVSNREDAKTNFKEAMMPEEKGSDDEVMNSKKEDLEKEASPYDDIIKERKEAIEESKAKEAKPEYEPLENFKVKTTHTVAAGENVSMISEKYYKTGVNWIYIYRANLGVIGDNPDIIQAGMELKIPAL